MWCSPTVAQWFAQTVGTAPAPDAVLEGCYVDVSVIVGLMVDKFAVVPTTSARKSKGIMKQTYFWPIYGEQDEIAFTWSTSRGMLHAQQQLTGFTGTLLTDGYAAYSQATAKLNETDAKIVHANSWAHTRRY